MACDCKDEDEQKSAKFLIGLNTPIANLVELQVYHSFDELCQLATKVERQQKEAKGKSTRFSFTPKTETSSSIVKTDTFDKGKGGEEEFKTPPNVVGQKGMRERVCFKCQGQGHIAKQCPNRMLITLEERFALLTQQMEEASGEKAREDERSPEATLHDMADPSFWAATPIYEPEAKRGLIVRRTLVAAPLEDATDEQRENLFESRCLINVDGARVGLKPLPPKRNLIPMPKESASSVQDGGGHVCLQSCRDEMLETASTKKERSASVLHLRQDSRLSEGDYVWLSLSAQKLHIDHKNDEPMDEGPFKVVKKLGFDTYKNLL
ncbi:hypothetical protein BVRB_003660 [Beta vulgaris subsp. vulgaris]|uniref:CCHC-type domain-containing protein n=1 Tax=Beta vulgaris subsp. vulgaris TaxID=3555 RepID=A0A0J8DYH5_BETVV|nr:hypothetical protein BVRB_003660 [Beta vulgaris subsp. vulgaris]